MTAGALLEHQQCTNASETWAQILPHSRSETWVRAYFFFFSKRGYFFFSLFTFSLFFEDKGNLKEKYEKTKSAKSPSYFFFSISIFLLEDLLICLCKNVGSGERRLGAPELLERGVELRAPRLLRGRRGVGLRLTFSA